VTAAALRSRFEVVRAADILAGDILRNGGSRVARVTGSRDGVVRLVLANGRTMSLPPDATMGVYR
jgi:hypothetical protein